MEPEEVDGLSLTRAIFSIGRRGAHSPAVTRASLPSRRSRPRLSKASCASDAVRTRATATPTRPSPPRNPPRRARMDAATRRQTQRARRTASPPRRSLRVNVARTFTADRYFSAAQVRACFGSSANTAIWPLSRCKRGRAAMSYMNLTCPSVSSGQSCRTRTAWNARRWRTRDGRLREVPWNESRPTRS
jgi:hypothetical protein